MTELAIVEAVRAAGGAGAAQAAQSVQQAVDPQAVQAFQNALAPEPVAEIPLAAQIAETWGASQSAYQQHLHRVTALTDMTKMGRVSMAQLSQLQYEVASLTFQQDVVTNIAKKASDAVSTLVKNG